MANLSIQLLGQFHITRNGQPVSSFSTAKVQALFAYLAVEINYPHQRLSLAHLLWPDQPDSAALHNLRQALTTLRRAIGDQQARPPYLLITRQSLQFNRNSAFRLDVADFLAQLRPNKQVTNQDQVAIWQRAFDVYRGDFLTGMTIPDSEPFEEWLTLQREYYRREAVETIDLLAAHFELEAEYEPAIRYTRRHLELAPWQEAAHRRLMRCLALNGQRNAALAHYDICQRLLVSELDVEPAEETRHLFEQIRAGDLDHKRANNLEEKPLDPVLSSGPDLPTPLHRLPAQLTSFISRKRELAQLGEYLTDPSCRLVTLVGAGGVGKTRLALKAAEQYLDEFRDGVHFVPLAAVRSAEVLATAISSVLQLSFADHESPKAQLLSYLRSKQMLLVLDNFEHLLADLDLVINLLRTAAELKLMVTSRERLNLQAEWLLHVEGLSFPAPLPNQSNGSPYVRQASKAARDGLEEVGPNGNMTLENFGAVRLFVQRAKQARPNFALSAETAPSIVRLCQLAEGLPLAIELAAAQVDKYSPDDIVRDFEVNMDRLATTKRDMPARHRNLRALFDSSWERLAKTEQDLFQRLSVFLGGFNIEAALEVAQAVPDSIAILYDKSMLRQISPGRYEIHELLRQYAVEKLKENPEQYTAMQNRHCAYYAGFLYQRQAQLRWGSGPEVVAEVEQEIENIRASWHWAIGCAKIAELEQAQRGLFRLYYLRNWHQEGAAVFGQAAAMLVDKQSPGEETQLERLAGRQEEVNHQARILNLESEILLAFAYFAEATNDHSAALTAAQEAVRLALQTHHAKNETRAYLAWGRALWGRGKHKSARTVLVQALTLARSKNDTYHQAQSLHYLGNLYRHRGNHDIAREHIKQALNLYRAGDNRQEEARSLSQLGNIYSSRGDYSTARSYLEQALKIYRHVGDRHLEQEPLRILGIMHRYLGLYEEAHDYFEQVLHITREFGNRQATAFTLNQLGLTYWYLLDNETARAYCQEALTISRDIGNQYTEGYSQAHLGHILASMGDLQRAGESYRRALYLRRKIGQPDLAIVDLAGLAWVTMVQGQTDLALTQVDDILSWIEANDMAYLVELPQVYWVCYQVLHPVGNDGDLPKKRALKALEAAYATLQERTRRIEDDYLQHSYLRNVAIHRHIIAAWEGIKQI